MSDVITIRPKDDAAARQASTWCDEFTAAMTAGGHTIVEDVDDLSPADTKTIIAAFRRTADLICYFGHGEDDAWSTHGAVTVDGASILAARGKCVISIACNTGRAMGPNAVTGGVASWLGFTIQVPVVSPYKTRDGFGEAIVEGLKTLVSGGTMQQARDDVSDALDALSRDFDTGGSLSGHAHAWLGHFGAIALHDHVTVNGTASVSPL